MNRMKSFSVRPLSEEDEGFASLGQAAYDLAKSVGIHVMSNRDCAMVATEGGRVVGALFSGLSGGEYSFDVVVAKDRWGSGIGTALTTAAVADLSDLPDDIKIQADVINPAMEHILGKLGFSVVLRRGTTAVMEPRPVGLSLPNPAGPLSEEEPRGKEPGGLVG